MYKNNFYKNLIKPSFNPPKEVFRIVWPILYGLMIISFLIIALSNSNYKILAFTLFIIQLFLNLIWSPVFFLSKMLKGAFFISLCLTISVFLMIIVFYNISKFAAILQIPYFLWLCFATILNATIVKLNS